MSDALARVTVSEAGPYRVEAGTVLLDGEGNRVETSEGKPFFLCRCGQSSNKPFCDGTHSSADWDPSLAPSK